jgi:MFS transporter, DHA1 family, inner membrane transport protein
MDAMTSLPAQQYRRAAITWYCFLTISFFTFVLNIQGNILPFLKSELELSYRTLGLHSSALAAGMVMVGIVGDRVIHALGRRATLFLAMAGTCLGAGLLCVASSPVITIASCFLIGGLGGLIPGTVFAVLADEHGKAKDVAFAECMAVCYAFAILAPLTTSLCIGLALGWRVAVLFGIALGIAIVAAFRGAAFPAETAREQAGEGSLHLAFWVYWLSLAMAVAIEFCVILWSPEYLERVVGLSRTAAAGWAASFFLAMLLGRTAGSALIRHVPRLVLYLGTVAVTLAGFLLYWLGPNAYVAVAGLFGLGLGISLLYPVCVSSAIGAAGALGERAGTRLTIAVGLAILTMPALLGSLADVVGLHRAHLVMPVIVLVSGAAFVAAGRLERRAA